MSNPSLNTQLIAEFISKVRSAPDTIEFSQVMQLIKASYTYTPTRFINAELINDAGTNEGSCKIFYFAQLYALTQSETLSLFGTYYRDDVLANPEGSDHANIRSFMVNGWEGINFEGAALD